MICSRIMKMVKITTRTNLPTKILLPPKNRKKRLLVTLSNFSISSTQPQSKLCRKHVKHMGPFSNSIYLWTQLRQQTRNQSTQEGRLSPTNFWKMPKLVWKAYKLWMADRYERNWLAANHRPTKHPRQPCHAILWAKTLAKNAFGVGNQVTWRPTAKTSLFRNHVHYVPWRITRWEPVH